KGLAAVAAELLADIANDLARLLSGDVARGKILHKALVAASAEGYQVATKSDVLGTQGHPDAGRFQRRSAGMIDRRIVAHDAHIPDIAAGRKAVRNYVGDTEYAMESKPRHVGGTRRSLRGFCSSSVQVIRRLGCSVSA